MTSDKNNKLSGQERIAEAIGEVLVEDGPGDLDWILDGLKERGNDRMLLDGLDVRVDKWKVKMVLVETGRFYHDDSERWHYGERTGHNRL